LTITLGRGQWGLIPRLTSGLEVPMFTRVLSILTLLKVATVKTISSILYPDSKNPHSSVVQTQKQLNVLVATGKLKRGHHWYAVNEYEGQFLEHDQKRTEVIARLIRLKLPISVFTEVSFPIGIRSDVVVLIGRNGKAICSIIEICNKETEKYLQMKLNALKNWTGTNEALSKLFGCHIPTFSVVVSKNQTDDGFSKMIGGLKCLD